MAKMTKDEFKTWVGKNLAMSKAEQKEMENDIQQMKEEIDAVREHDPIMAKKMEAITFAADDFLQYMIQIGKDMGIDR